ncbi:alpha-mannosidase/mannosylglycerate hydrolase [Entomoplasma freundtii]|uniref:Glycosyl hydrolase n=1 Tax=Entomoplasma freundtii TaxID=74700 RepID=A0A2K8NUL4_9MOLU|nr:glycoside hydrolase family 38 C-terminal domain-containing protein [Entomoplasma freundtii]ATZ16313.1 glycosyl hydrolase [Entomoplasma freundtii]TDY56785.1 alpha-mannosidase/mannosylglycerate hydrolase [Entomoplasma freundtii]
MKKWKIHFIPQTHWDKEWYFTKDVSDIFLIDNIDKIYDIYKRDSQEFDKFIYDGQYSVVDDYLRYFPENKAKVEELVQANKLVLGPWYTQTDTFNATGESIVRNLLVGTKSTEKLGGDTMHVGYIPDSFGFNANLPQILKKANLKGLVHWRGIYQKQIEKGVFNQWTGIDGTTIPIYNLFKHGYGIGVGPSLERFVEKWTLEDMAEQAKIYLENAAKHVLPLLEEVSKNTGGLILMPFGSDQLPIYDGLAQWMVELNKIDPEHEWVLSDYDTFMDDLFTRTQMQGLGNIEGELRFGQFSRTHKTITSSRYDIKYLGKKLEYLIYHETEPLGIMFEKYGGNYPAEIIEYNLKRLLESQAHDSAGACNTDETNNTIVERLNAAIAALESLNTLMKRRITEAHGLQKNELAVFNLKPYAKNIEDEIAIFTRKPSFKILDNDKEVMVNVRDQKHINIEEFKMYENAHRQDYNFDEKGQFWTTINADFGMIEPLSFKVFKIEEQASPWPLIVAKEDWTIENDDYALVANPETGHINLLIKENDQLVEDAFVLESQFDAGDSYDFSPSKIYPGVTSTFVKLTAEKAVSNGEQTLNLFYKFKVAKELDSKEEINQDLKLRIILNKKTIKFTLDLDNQAKDIKWKMNCKTGLKATTSFGDTSFGVIERPLNLTEQMAVWETEKWHDCPIEIEAMESVCYLKDHELAYALTTLGNNEYQILNDNIISLTLFRGYSTIGRRGLAYRPGRSSGIDHYPHATPEANLNKPLSIEFNVLINQLDNLVRIAKDKASPAVYYQKQDINPFHWKGDTFVMAKKPLSKGQKFSHDLNLPENIVVSAFKKAYDKNGYVIRMYNPTFENVAFLMPNEFKEMDLMENQIAPQTSFGANEVRTFWVENV